MLLVAYEVEVKGYVAYVLVDVGEGRVSVYSGEDPGIDAVVGASLTAARMRAALAAFRKGRHREFDPVRILEVLVLEEDLLGRPQPLMRLGPGLKVQLYQDLDLYRFQGLMRIALEMPFVSQEDEGDND